MDPHNPYAGIKATSKPIGTGLFRVGTIEKINLSNQKMTVLFRDGTSIDGSVFKKEVDIPYALTYNNGMFMGSIPSEGTNAVFGVDGNNQPYFVSFLPENRQQLPVINNNELAVLANSNSKLSLNKDKNFSSLGKTYLGSDFANIYLHVDSQHEEQNLFRLNFDNEQHITPAYRKIIGIIKRESKEPQELEVSLDNRLNDDQYDQFYKIISLDPTRPNNVSASSKSKNPPLVENREIIYEFVEKANIRNEIDEASIYTGKPTNPKYSRTNRRKTKSDTLSLSLVYPNYLIETVKGTVVDIFGNILDLNRSPIPIGTDQNTLNPKISTDLSKSYTKIRELERKSIAYHFEINARKDFTRKKKLSKIEDGEDIVDSTASSNIADLFGFNEKFPNADYGKNRSRFHLDIDKEGQFKFNVPSSSEVGNLPLLTMYENFSKISEEVNNNPNKLIWHPDSLDILQDSFACPKFNFGDDNKAGTYEETPGSITIKDGEGPIKLKDRRYGNVHLKHGTAYHDILQTCYAHQSMKFINYISPEIEPPYSEIIAPLSDQVLKNVVSDTIQISGEGANAGGRSGAINFDGSLELNIGANTVDRQSLWLDTAGGIVGNIGRDKKNMSAALSMNGDVFVQIGGFGVVGDSRFIEKQNGYYSAVLDLRVLHTGFSATMLRIDDNGVTLLTPQNLTIHAGGDMLITGGTLEIDVEECIIQGRGVNKEFGGSI